MDNENLIVTLPPLPDGETPISPEAMAAWDASLEPAPVTIPQRVDDIDRRLRQLAVAVNEFDEQMVRLTKFISNMHYGKTRETKP